MTAVPLFVPLVLVADSPTDKLACAVYGAGVTAMLTVSATYHSPRRSAIWHQRLRPWDHSMIFVAIAGSYTGIGTLALDAGHTRTLLAFVWIAAAVALVVRVTWPSAPIPILTLAYVGVGWSALIEIGPLLRAWSAADTVLVVGGGVVYTMGAVVFARRRPDPAPAVFGFHEIFHTCVVIGAAMQYAAAMHLAIAAR